MFFFSDALLQPSIVKHYRARKALVFDGVWAGGENTFARDKNTGHIYAWGLNNYNQLGKRVFSYNLTYCNIIDK